LKLASVAIAFLLWSAMGSEPMAEVGYDVPLHLRNVPGGLELSSEAPTTVQVWLRGPSSALRQLSRSDFAVSIDLSGFHKPAERSFNLQVEVSLPLGVKVVRTAPSQVSIRLEERSERTLQVMARLVGTTAPGYRISRYEVSPEKVVVVGPRSRVSFLEQAFTDPIDVTGVIGRTQFVTNVFLPDPVVRLQTPQQVRVVVYMERR